MVDIARTDFAIARRKTLWTRAALGAAIAVVLIVAIARIRPASPVVPRSSIWTGKVTRGSMLREVRGTGTLVPLEIRWIPAPQAARVESIDVQAGAAVEPETILLRLTNPEIDQSANDARLALRAAEEELQSRTIEIESQLLAQRASAAAVSADAEEADRRLRVEEALSREGLTAAVTLDVARTRARALKTRSDIEQRRVAIADRSADAQRSVARSRVEQLRAVSDLRARQEQELVVLAGIRGVVQHVPVQVGQQVAAGTILAKVAQPGALKAELKIPETQARDIQLGQRVTIDTRNGVVTGSVIRVDPASQNGTVTVDVSLPAVLPRGARPDLTVDGTIELERLENVLWVARPLQVEDGTTVNLFRVVDGGAAAVRTQVRVGRASANAIEIVSGLAAGDEVVLSDMSAWSAHDRVRIE
jgi:HlyD family secretion protein